MSGYGEKNYVDGHVYRGLWYNSKYDDEHGELFQDGKIEYIGSFKEGQFDGKGKLFYKNGEIYEGYFSKGAGIDDEKHGKLGDMYIITNVIIPNKLDREQKALFKELADTTLDNNDAFKKMRKFL